LTRRINIYADKTLLAAYAAGTHTISADHVRAAISDTQIIVPKPAARRPVVIAALVGAIAGIVVGFVAGRGSVAPAPAVAQVAAPASVAPSTGAIAAVPEVPRPAVAEAKPAPADPVAARLAAGKVLVEGNGSGKFVIQLMTTDAREKGYLETYLAEASRALKSGELFLLASGPRESPRVIVLHGPFDQRAEAVAALENLPANLRQFRPYIRPVDAVRNDWLKTERS
jgi:septal ring-binding cell division protein DamX